MKSRSRGRELAGGNWTAFGVVLLSAFLLNWPHFYSYISDINFDIFIHYNWARETLDNFRDGAHYPRWTFNGGLGLGEPAFLFYSPLYYLASAWIGNVTGVPTWQAMHAVEVLSNTVFGLFVYATAAYYVDRRLALLVAVVAMFSPFLAMLHYKFHGLAWASVGYASHGMLLWAIFRPDAARTWVNIPAAIAIGLAVWSHTISALVNLICFSAVVLVRRHEGLEVGLANFGRAFAGWAMTVALGLALSAAYLLPALLSMSDINTTAWTGGHILQAFAWPTFTGWLHGIQWFSFQWPVALPALLLCALPAAYAFIYRRTDPVPAPVVYATAVSGFAFFFASELSYPLWRVDWPLVRIQLPYRFVSMMYLAGALACGLLLARVWQRGARRWSMAFASALVLSLLTGIGVAYKATYLDGKRLPQELAAGDYSFRPFEQLFRTTGFSGYCAEGDSDCRAMSLAAGGYRGVPEYETRWKGPESRAYAKGGLEAECAAVGAECVVTRRSGDGREWRIGAPGQMSLRLPVYHFPQWLLSVDGFQISHSIDERTGLIQIELPPGEHNLKLVWVASDLERNGWRISIAALLCTMVLLVAQRRARRLVTGMQP